MTLFRSKAALLLLLTACIHAQDAPPALVCSPLELGIAYTGFNMGNTSRTTAAECCDDCLNTSGCTIFVFHKNVCRLKTNAGPVVKVKGAVSSFIVPETPEPTPDEPTNEPTPTPDTCGCVGGSLCSEDGRCDACNMWSSSADGRVCEDRFVTTCRWYGQRWCGASDEPEPLVEPIGRCECHAGHKCDLNLNSCAHCNYPRLSAGPGQDGVCEDWERGACLHTFGGQWCGGLN
ncbi:hypothetical protein H310_14508 [Aphanomyces invadans]|uniref:Apple domain-containing protein n=1 Tax=Aphanomyces invadans TaxID=157072 RepID=A0A024TBN8_9STRA|nr:hypothetical protein H310_14508 [Aphanomyces invadans]ETV90772.1 hypothetical protein H310_14508 [Aphanomyces invadans]|eukprot:XP_008880608.1 hypothetical protein H310_14508 [Aphanomyces invadans]